MNPLYRLSVLYPHIQTITLLILLLILSTATTAQTRAGIDLEAVMKQMRFEYTQALKSETSQAFNQHITEFKRQLKIARQFPFTDERVEKATRGLKEVTTIVEQLQLPIQSSALEAAKRSLYSIDDLRKKYHDKKPSLWERFYEMLFGIDENNPPLILLD